ncbi:YheC/YheD family endospore coat-associated protein [Xylanibacillus composti]|uniref:YheC/YheD family protein n=1 Tax=Xylanibacillus composti TaxID=1572762 RepID=A0A8J4M2C9_9BACL|nr:YheC/YheD family protein [Xylanibacillus composti]GIQ68406.1 hypothetical protein XYCOK13_12300 [Xylanibacillus composti]
MKTVGILVDAQVFRTIGSKKSSPEKLSIYNRAAAKHGLRPFYMCLEKTFPASGQAMGYRYANGKYRYVKLPIPKVIHNRSMPKGEKMRKRMRELAKKSHLFNERTRYSKYVIHQLLRGPFTAHLPATARYSSARLNRELEASPSFYVKPQSSSVGKGIIKITRIRNGKIKLQLPHRTTIADKRTAVKTINRVVRKQKYMIQQTIPLAKYKGRPYDIRVTVQRGARGQWQVTGMYGKVARKGSHVTNVARGGTAKACGSLFRHSFAHPSLVEQSTRQFSLQVARYLGNRLKRLADVGLDIGISPEGNPYFIEMNGRDMRYGFKKANMHKTFRRTYEAPIQYAKYLLKKR